MRLSGDERDRSHGATVLGNAARPEHATTRVRVYLRDALVEDVVTADDEEGLIVRLCRKPNGDFIIHHGVIRTETLRGDVRIELPAWWPKECRT